MNNKIKIIGAVLIGVNLGNPLCAEEIEPTVQATAEARVEDKINQYINGNLFGIQNVKKDANNRIVSVISIGRAPLSSAMTKARAKNQAFKKADANARAEFMKWLTTAVVYTRIDQDDIAIVQKGESLGDAGAGKSTEASDVAELTHEQTISVASGFVKGMIQIGAGMSEDGEAVVVLGWNADMAEQTDAIRDQNSPMKPARKNAATKGNAAGANEAPNKATSVSEAATDFL